MNTATLINEIKQRIAEGESKEKIFSKYRSNVDKESRLAFLIASVASPERVAEHRKSHLTLVSLVFLLTLPMMWLAHYFVTEIQQQGGPLEWFFTACIGLLFPVINGFGMWRLRLHAFTNFLTFGFLFIVMTVITMQQHAISLSLGIVAGLLAAIALLTYCVYVRSLLYPSVSLTGSVKKSVNGKYRFD
ncbi:hypothetical protein [Vibrio palustris]|uniref:Uncharacterized protein n=1 Tax=Vibrio palustris TaxID=1918946 RepID=A0A1R4B7C2_9VIBR|nr:hypothetical protein [Vibrio palustris]SJL84771.1 hypothetical protein VPAL9027_02768 [Vibrio palustris]